MPLWLREHSWRQSGSAVYLSLPVRGLRVTAANIFCTERYLKVGGGAAAQRRSPLKSARSAHRGSTADFAAFTNVRLSVLRAAGCLCLSPSAALFLLMMPAPIQLDGCWLQFS